jgi:hypothetical protein
MEKLFSGGGGGCLLPMLLLLAVASPDEPDVEAAALTELNA